MSAGLLAVAHDGGEVRLYQFCTTVRQVAPADLGSAVGHWHRGPEDDPPADQPPGYQHVLRVQSPSAGTASALALAPCAGLVGYVTSSGEISMVDFLQVSLRWNHVEGGNTWLLKFGNWSRVQCFGAV